MPTQFRLSKIGFELFLWTSVFFFFIIFAAYVYPSEDASILFSYAENWANSGVISYFPGGPATEGSTDFLFLCFITIGIKLGLSAHFTALVVSSLSVVSCVYLLDKLADSRQVFVRLAWVLGIVYSLQIYSGIYGYGTLLFGAGLIGTLYFFWKNNFKALVIFSLLTVLCRPDGILMVAPLVLYSCFSDGFKDTIRIKQLLLLGIVPGVIYYGIRFYYFQEFFPLPFYVKTQGERFFLFFQKDSLYAQTHYIKYYLFPIVISLIIGSALFVRDLSPKMMVIIGAYIIVPFLFYSCTQQDMNLGYRYQYPLYLGCLVLLAIYVQVFKASWLIVFLYWNVFLFIPSHLSRIQTQPFQIENNYVQVVKKLQKYNGVIAATDAGFIGWLSQWEVHDLWGLNSPQFSKKLASREDIEELNPDLVEIAPYDWDHSMIEKQEKTFQNLIQNTHQFIRYRGDEIWKIPSNFSTKSQLIWSNNLDSFFRKNSDKHFENLKDSVTFGIKKDFYLKDEIERIFIEHGGVKK